VSGELCESRRKPRHQRRCEIQACKPVWLTTDWSQCSSSECDELGDTSSEAALQGLPTREGVSTREVVCLDKDKISASCTEPKPRNSKVCKVKCELRQSEAKDWVDDSAADAADAADDRDWEEYDEFLDEPAYRDVSPVEDYLHLERAKEKSSTTEVHSEDQTHEVTTRARPSDPSTAAAAAVATKATFQAGAKLLVSNDVLSQKPVKPSKVSKVTSQVKATKNGVSGSSGGQCIDKFKNCNIVVQSRLCIYSFYQVNCCTSCTLTLP